MRLNKAFLYSCIASILMHPFACGKVLIWDLGGVLFQENHLALAHKIGIRRFLSYSIRDHKTPFIEPLILDILATFGAQEGKPEERACTKHGAQIPAIMCQWFAGTKSSSEIIESVSKRIEELDKAGYFISPRQKKLAQNTLKVMFDPVTIGHNMIPIPQGIKLLKDCASRRNKDGTKKHRLFVLSNWDSLSFEILHDRNKEVFSLFDPKHILISGRIGFVKPHRECFEHLIKTYKLNPQECIFIDDQEINVKNAQSFKMTALLVKKGDYRTLRKKLQELAVL